MGLRKILTDKEPALHKVCKPVVNFDAKLFKLLDDMKETLQDANGVGLAAPQVGILRRVVLVDTGEEVLELVNPELLETDGEQERARKVRPCKAALLCQGSGAGSPRGVVRVRGRGADCPVLLPRAGSSGRHCVY